MLEASVQHTKGGLAMRLTRLWHDCPDTESCPTLYWTDRGTAVVQGYLVTNLETLSAPLGIGEAVVEVPFALFSGFAINGAILHPTERGTILVRGTVVTDPEALTTLRLPVGEAAVEIRLSPPASLITREVPA
jgi:hypothetical protein